MSIASLNIPMTPTERGEFGGRVIAGFVRITSPYRDHEDWMLERAIADLEKDGIAWRLGQDRCLYRSANGAMDIDEEDDTETEEEA